MEIFTMELNLTFFIFQEALKVELWFLDMW